VQLQSKLESEQRTLQQQMEQLEAQQAALQRREVGVSEREATSAQQDIELRKMTAEVSTSRGNAETSLRKANKLREQVDRDMALLTVRARSLLFSSLLSLSLLSPCVRGHSAPTHALLPQTRRCACRYQACVTCSRCELQPHYC
jgi:hypothetical protein